MKLPKIDATTLPDLEQLTGMFGAMRQPGHDDTIVVIASIVYDTTQAGGGLI